MGMEVNEGCQIDYALPSGLETALVNAGTLQPFTCIGWLQIAQDDPGPFTRTMFQILDANDAVIFDYFFNSSASGKTPLGNWFSYLRGDSSVFRAITGKNYPAAGSVVLFAVYNSLSVRTMFVRHTGQATLSNSSNDADPVIQQPKKLRFTGFAGARWGFAIRNHTIAAADIDAIWDSGQIHSIFTLDNTGSGGNMNGLTGCLLGFDNGMLSQPNTVGANLSLSSHLLQRPVPGDSLKGAVMIRDTNASNNPAVNECLRLVTFNGAGDLPRFASISQPKWNNEFFQNETRSGTFNADLSGGKDQLRRLVTDRPNRACRVLLVERSRASFLGNGGGGLPPNYTAGICKHSQNIIGVDNIPLATQRGNTNPIYDFEYQVKESAVPLLLASASGQTTMNYYAWGQNPGTGNGNGYAHALEASQTVRIMAKPYQKLTADKEMRQVVHYMAWPLGPQFRYRTAIDGAQIQTDSEVLGAWSSYIDSVTSTAAEVTLDATMASSYSAGSKSIVLTGTSLGIEAGMMCVRASTYDVANVASVVEGGGNTTVTFDFAFDTAPVNTNVLTFGPWEYRKLTVDHAALDKNDPVSWRGIELECEAGGLGLVVFGIGAWAKDTPGFILVSGAKGGSTYAQQLATVNVTGPTGPTSAPKYAYWRDVCDPDVTLVFDNDSTDAANEEVLDLAIQATTNGDVAGLGSWFNGATLCNPLQVACAARELPYTQVYLQGGNADDWYARGYWGNTSVHQSAFGAEVMLRQLFAGLDTATAALGQPSLTIEGAIDEEQTLALERKLGNARENWVADYV